MNAFFAGRDADSIAVDPALAADPGRLAVGRGGGPADNANIHALGEAFAAPVAGSTAGAFAGRSVQGLWGETVAAVSRGAAEETAFAEGAALHRDALVGQRERFSGVSLDEEAVRIMGAATALPGERAGDLRGGRTARRPHQPVREMPPTAAIPSEPEAQARPGDVARGSGLTPQADLARPRLRFGLTSRYRELDLKGGAR